MSKSNHPNDKERFRALLEYFPGLARQMCAKKGLNFPQALRGLHEGLLSIQTDDSGCEYLASNLLVRMEDLLRPFDDEPPALPRLTIHDFVQNLLRK